MKVALQETDPCVFSVKVWDRKRGWFGMKSFLDFIQLSLLSIPHSMFETRARYSQLVRKRENQSKKMLDWGPSPFPETTHCTSYSHVLYSLLIYIPNHQELKKYLLSHPIKLPKISVNELSSASLLLPPEVSANESPRRLIISPETSANELSSATFLLPEISENKSSQPIYHVSIH